MTIQKLKIGAHGKKTVYALCNEAAGKTGGSDELCRFDTLETATNVLRYIRGDIQTREQIADAIAAIRTIDERGTAMPMSEAAKQARRDYKRKWNAENKDKVKQYQRTYWERKADSTRQKSAEIGSKGAAANADT